MCKRSFQKIELAQELPSQHVVDFIFHAERLHGPLSAWSAVR